MRLVKGKIWVSQNLVECHGSRSLERFCMSRSLDFFREAMVLHCCHEQLARFLMVTQTFCLLLTSMVTKHQHTHRLPLETKSVAHGNNIVLTCKLCHQTSIAPYSTDNRSISNLSPPHKVLNVLPALSDNHFQGLRALAADMLILGSFFVLLIFALFFSCGLHFIEKKTTYFLTGIINSG